MQNIFKWCRADGDRKRNKQARYKIKAEGRETLRNCLDCLSVKVFCLQHSFSINMFLLFVAVPTCPSNSQHCCKRPIHKMCAQSKLLFAVAHYTQYGWMDKCFVHNIYNDDNTDWYGYYTMSGYCVHSYGQANGDHAHKLKEYKRKQMRLFTFFWFPIFFLLIEFCLVAAAAGWPLCYVHCALAMAIAVL